MDVAYGGHHQTKRSVPSLRVAQADAACMQACVPNRFQRGKRRHRAECHTRHIQMLRQIMQGCHAFRRDGPARYMHAHVVEGLEWRRRKSVSVKTRASDLHHPSLFDKGDACSSAKPAVPINSAAVMLRPDDNAWAVAREKIKAGVLCRNGPDQGRAEARRSGLKPADIGGVAEVV